MAETGGKSRKYKNGSGGPDTGKPKSNMKKANTLSPNNGNDSNIALQKSKEGKRRLTFVDDKMPDSRKKKLVEGEAKPEWYEELDERQISMFKDLFELLDRDGGGSIDAEELYEVMKELDIGVTKDEIVSVLKELDKDGNGEIDFDEFLYCMTETEKFFLDSLADVQEAQDERDDADKAYSKRQSLFFSAITKFAIKNSLGEIERYYAAKARHVPHVISHYTAGARLIGLTDRQIERHLAKIHKTSKGLNSPYAKPLHFVTLASKKPTRGRSSATGKKSGQGQFQSVQIQHPGARRGRRQAVTQACHSEDDMKILDQLRTMADKGNVIAKLPEVHMIPQIRQKLVSGEIDDEHPIMSTMRKRRRSNRDSVTNDNKFGVRGGLSTKAKDSKQGNAKHTGKLPMKRMVPQTTSIINRTYIPLPLLKLGVSDPTIEDLPNIREKVQAAINDYYTSLRKRTVRSAWAHWDELYCDQIQSKTLQDNFKETYRAYSPHKEEQAFVICPWIPGPRYSSPSPALRPASAII